MTDVRRHPIQLRELQDAMPTITDVTARRAAAVVEDLMMGRTVIIEERVGQIGGEEIIEETILEAQVPS